jgi:serine/threonine-protein kinase RsbW
MRLSAPRMAGTPHVLLRLSSRAENVLLVRQALSGLAESIGLDSVALNDISTAVSEACNNVVLHAYEGEEGPLEVEIRAQPPGLCIAVRDAGCGIRPGAHSAGDGADGIGLPVIRALADGVEVSEPAGGGTEVLMEFATVHGDALERGPHEDSSEYAAIAQHELANTIVMAVAPASLARTVLPRVACALAARAHFSTDRIADLRLVADALATRTAASISTTHLDATIRVEPSRLELRVGPLRAGHADALLLDCAVDGLGHMVQRLGDGHEVSSLGTSEVLSLQIGKRR